MTSPHISDADHISHVEGERLARARVGRRRGGSAPDTTALVLTTALAAPSVPLATALAAPSVPLATAVAAPSVLFTTTDTAPSVPLRAAPVPLRQQAIER